MNCDLTTGERDLLVRALRYFAGEQQRAIQAALLAGKSDAQHVKREALQYIGAAERLIAKLRPNFQTKG